ncbi:MAG: hypothetical protein IMW98_07530 [Firmicutes bacterium]|nr:hypothetical protein [Bacillota bacterium]
MSLDALREEIRRGFDLDAQVSLTELRQPEWRRRLAAAGKLRVVHRHEVVGVLLSPDAWRAVQRLEAYAEQLEEQLEQLEIERVWGERLDHERRPAEAEARKARLLLEEE